MRILLEILPRTDENLACLTFVLEIAADTSRRGIRRNKIRILILKRLELIHQMVVVIVAHCRSVLDVVLAAVLPEDFPDFPDSYFGLLSVHH